MYANSTIGGGGFGSSGNATLMKVTDNIFSSIEPTAADCLYCYRVFAVPAAATSGTGIERVGLPAKKNYLRCFYCCRTGFRIHDAPKEIIRTC